MPQHIYFSIVVHSQPLPSELEVHLIPTPIFSLAWQMKLPCSFQIVCNKVMSPHWDAISGWCGVLKWPPHTPLLQTRTCPTSRWVPGWLNPLGRNTVNQKLIRLWLRDPLVLCQTFPRSGTPLQGPDATLLFSLNSMSAAQVSCSQVTN